MTNIDVMNGPTDPHGYGQDVPPVTVGHGFTIGFVEEIHGEAGRPVPEYIPTLTTPHWPRPGRRAAIRRGGWRHFKHIYRRA